MLLTKLIVVFVFKTVIYGNHLEGFYYCFKCRFSHYVSLIPSHEVCEAYEWPGIDVSFECGTQ